MLKAKGATIVGVDRNEPKENVDQFIKADLGDPDELRQPRSGRNTDSAGLSGNPGQTGRRAKIMDRPGRPEDIAPVIAFMCSDGSSWIRGANIPCDGGMYQHLLCNMHGHV